MAEEVWKDITGYEGLYQVSTIGRVKSFNGLWVEEKILAPGANQPRGYLYVNLCKDGKRKNFYVHRLVAQTFISNSQNKLEVNHINGNKLDNRVENLEWATSSENHRHAYAMGLMKSGEEHPNSKLTNEQVRYIRANPDGLNTCELGRKFGVGDSAITEIQLGKKRKAAGGFVRGKIERRLNDEKRAEIRKLYKTGNYSQDKLGKMFGVAQRTVCRIIHEND